MTIERLPLERTFSGTIELAPGVADSGVAITNTLNGFNAGGGRQDNQFFYDGVNVTNPFYADQFQDFAELDIQEVSITRAGLTPEYGRTGGFIVNGVTKSGTNTLHGDARVEYSPSSLSANSKDPNNTAQLDRWRPGVGIGGPILPDRVFFYGSTNFFQQKATNVFNNFNLGGAPNPLPESDLDIHEYFGKLTATPTSSQLLEASYRYRTASQSNAGIMPTDAASTAVDTKELDRIIVGSWFWTASSRLNLEAKYNHNENHGGATPVLALGVQPPFDPNHPELDGYFAVGNGTSIGGASLATNRDDFRRSEYRFTTSYLGGFFGASHDIRAGATFSDNREDLLRISNGWGAVALTKSRSHCGIANDSVCYKANFKPAQPPQISKAETIGLFAQDQMTWKSLTINAGVLVNRDHYIPRGGYFIFESGGYTIPNDVPIPACGAGVTAPACTYRDTLTFPFSKQWQPRIGIAYEVDSGAHDKLYANFARYDNLDNQSIARAAAPFSLLHEVAYLDRVTGQVIGVPVSSNQQDKRILPGLDPTYTDEYLVGYARPLGRGFSIEAWGMYRRTTDIIEDFAANGNDPASPNPSDFRYGNIPGYRKYRALTVEVRRTSADNRWTADLSYTLSRLEGNWDLDYSTSLFYASSYIQDGPGLLTTDPLRNGILTGDRTHVAKLFASYSLTTNTTLGGYLRFQSGLPWQAQVFDPSYQVPGQYAERAGSRRLSSWTNLDLLLAQTIPIGGVVTFRLEGRLLNVFNTQPPLSVDPVLYGDPENTIPNPDFAHATSYAPPRRFLLTGLLSF